MTLDLSDHSIYYVPYTLRSVTGLNAASSRRTFEGVLIKVGSGYGCIHPWPELGDPSLEKCLKDLKGAQRWPIVKRALRCAKMDGDARELEDWMFDDVDVPESHATLTELTEESVETAVARTFRAVKCKVGRHLRKESAFLNDMAKAYPSLRWRLDFNERLEPDEAVAFVKSFSDELRNTIDFIEDPSAYSPEPWKRIRREIGLNLAVDRESSQKNDGAQVIVIKPSIDEPFILTESAVNQGKPAIITSYMQHPVGQAFDAWNAMSMGITFPGAIDLCGLQTHGLFEKTEFIEALGPVQPEFTPSEGLGLGFDELLKNQEWKRLE